MRPYGRTDRLSGGRPDRKSLLKQNIGTKQTKRTKESFLPMHEYRHTHTPRYQSLRSATLHFDKSGKKKEYLFFAPSTLTIIAP